MAKITIGGEVFSFDFDLRPMSEMLALERETGMLFGQWEQEWRGGGAKATAIFCWLVWRRNGREVKWADFWGPIEAGEKDFDLSDFKMEVGEVDADPTPAPAGTKREASSSTAAATSAPSPKS